MTKSFKYLLENLIKAVDDTNEQIIKNMINTEYELACIKQNVTYEIYYLILVEKWNKIIDELIEEKDNSSTISELYYAEKVLKEINNIPINSVQSIQSTNELLNNVKSDFIKFLDPNNKNDDDNSNKIFDVLTDLIMTDDVYLNTNITTTLTNFSNFFKTRSIYWLWDIIILCASNKIKAEFPTYNKNSVEHKKQVNSMLRGYFNQIKDILQVINKDTINNFFNKNIEITSNVFTKLFEMSKIDPSNNNLNSSFIEKELDTMIPDKIGPLKCFFVDLIQYYYSTDVLHPIIWAQILRSMFINFLKNPPMSKIELFQFFSKHLLLNSGPFILKILQQVRPIMSHEQQKTYNLTKLTYPKMTESQYKLILGKVVKDWNLYNVYGEASASVGHVFFLQHSITLEKFVVKVVKPLSIIQSCYEYSKLNTFFEKNTLEQNFVHNMLYSTGKELQTKNEIQNINQGHKLYTINYNELYNNINIDASLTTIKTIENIIIDNCWFALTMTIAPGIPISELLESSDKMKLSTDTPYRAYLHRCFDLLVYKFFNNIIKNGFYHGDLHAGNVYFSFIDKPQRKAQITLIDFGAVNTIDLFNNNSDINELIKIIIQSLFFNYNNLLDTLTDLLNRKNVSKPVDKSSDSYKKFKNDLREIKINNITNNNKNPNINDNFIKTCINNSNRVNTEISFHDNHDNNTDINNSSNTHHANCYSKNIIESDNIVEKTKTTVKSKDSLFDYLEEKNNIIKDNKKSIDIENNKPLPSNECDNDIQTDMISFTEVINKIMEFYSRSNINIPITIPELYELLKACILIIGLAKDINYNSLRMSIIIGKILYDYENIMSTLKHPLIVYKMYNVYNYESKKYKEFLKSIL